MCGIAGLRRFDGEPIDPLIVESMAATLRHRGPDETGFWFERSVAFGHARLSIIDVEGSHQPMASPDRRFQIVLNGEVLNYRELRAQLSFPFRTHGDTEVLLALFEKFGPSAFEKLRGQFAFAIHDSATGETHLVRDRIGILPLYYYSDDKVFAFASEIKALLPLPPTCRIDDESLHDYLSHRVVPAPYTLISDVRKVLPGHHLVVKPDGTITSEPYWQLPDDCARLDVDESEAVRLVDQALTDSVREALIADVPSVFTCRAGSTAAC